MDKTSTAKALRPAFRVRHIPGPLGITSDVQEILDSPVATACGACHLVFGSDHERMVVMALDHYFGNDLVTITRVICHSCFEDVRESHATKHLQEMFRSAAVEAALAATTEGT